MTDRGDDLSRRTVLGAFGVAATTGLGATGAAAGRGRGRKRSRGRDREPGSGDGCPGAGHRSSPAPGPDVLYDEPVQSPKLSPGGGWEADPLLVSGGEAHVDGEYLYQGWVHDDYGAATDVPTGADSPMDEATNAPEGDLVYPTDEERYRYNAADVLEVRARPTAEGVAYRIALNTMAEPDAAVVALGIDTGSGDRTDWGHGLGDLGAPVDHVLVTWGEGATLDGEPLADDAVSVDTERNQLTVEVPLDPGRETWTHYGVAGVHDGEGGFAQVEAQPTETAPGGAIEDVPPVFDVAFRTHEDEPLRDFVANSQLPASLEVSAPVDDADLAVVWREKAQAAALADRDISQFGADVDFGALRDGVTERNVPRRGYLNRLYASRYDFGEGVDPASRPLLLGDVQPYTAYVPESYEDGDPAPLFVVPHSLGQNYNQHAGTPNLFRQLGEQRDAIVLVLQGRGPDGWWRDEAELDVFEAMADLTARYDVDLDRVTVGGYSMGGYGTYKLASQYPDLFGAGFAVVGPADEDVLGGPSNDELSTDDDSQNTMRITDNLRHVPLLMWAGTNDELVPYLGVRNYRRQLADHGYRHRLDSFPGFEHFTHFLLDEWGPGAEFLGDAGAADAPERVTYRRVPEFDNERFDLVHDGAYWVQSIEVADDADDGLVDATSLADGYGEPVAESYETAATDPAPNTREGVHWRSALAERAAENAIELSLEGVAAVTLYVDETGVDVTGPLTLRVDSTHEAAVMLESDVGTETVPVPAGESSETVALCSRGPPKGESQRLMTPDPDL